MKCCCEGEYCADHEPFECPNEPAPPIGVVLDVETEQPVPDSARGLCEACRVKSAAYGEELEAG